MVGTPWMVGWMCSQDNTLDPWTSKWFVLRSYALAMYKDTSRVLYFIMIVHLAYRVQDPLKPELYIPIITIKSIEKVEYTVTKKKLSLKIVTKSGTHFLSTECSDLDSKHRKHEHEEEELDRWIDFITSMVKVCTGTIA